MNIVLWIVQIFLAVVFIGSGVAKTTQPPEKLAPRMPWVPRAPLAFVRFLGACELLAGIGLLLPGLTRILPWLTTAAAVGLIVVMVCAIVVNVRLGEHKTIRVNVIFLALAAFIVVGRIALHPF